MKFNKKNLLKLSIVSSALIASSISIGAVLAQADTTVQSEFVGSNITLQNDIKMNYYFTLAAGDEFDYAEFTFGEDAPVKVSEYTTTENGYQITFEGISPDKLDTNLSTVIYLKGGASIEKTSDSVIAYCTDLLAQNSRQYKLGGLEQYATKRLVADLLTYGNESYQYVNKTAEDASYVATLMTDELTALQTPFAGLEQGGAAFEGEEGAAVWYSATANFYSNVRLSFKFYVDGAADEAYTVSVDNGGTVDSLTANKVKTEGERTYYQALYGGVSLLDFDADLKVTVLNAENQTISNTLSYGVADYVYNKQEDAEMSELVKATYNYGLSAQNYVSELNIPTEDGVTTPFRLEMENAELVGLSGGGGQSPDVGLFESRSYFFNPRLSGGIALRNFSPKESYRTNSATFHFTSDKTVRVKAIIGVSAGQEGAEDILDWYVMKNNGRSLVSSAIIPAKEDLPYLPYSNNSEYYKMTTIEVEMVIFEGANEFVISPQNRSGTGNIDYIEFQTTANITDYEIHWMEDNSVWEVTQAPTRAESGILQVTSPDKVATGGTTGVNTFELPNFTDEMYTYTSTEDKDIYSFMLHGQEFKFELNVAREYTLTLTNGATFADDGLTSKSIMEGDTVPSITVPQQSGRTLVGFYDTELGEQVYNTTDAMLMANRDMTIAPLFKSDDTYAFGVSTSGGYGFLSEAGQNDKGEDIAAMPAVSGADGVVGDEVGKVITSEGAIQDGMSFRAQTTFNRQPVDYIVTYTFQNFSDESLAFRVYQTNSGSILSPYYADVELAAGEVKTVSYSFYFDGTTATGSGGATNGNTLTYFCFTANNSEGLKLGVVMKIVEDENGEHAAGNYQLTLTDGLTFADGSTSKAVKAYTALSELGIQYSGPLTGTVKYLDKSTLTLVPNMTESDVTVSPYVDQKGFGTGQNGNAVNNATTGVSGKTTKRTGTNQVGYSLNITGIQAGSKARLTTPRTNGSTSDSYNWEITYVFVNTGSSDISFTLYQINAGTTTSGMDNEKVSIAAGESTTATLSITSKYSNKNFLSYFQFDGAYGTVTMNVLMMARQV